MFTTFSFRNLRQLSSSKSPLDVDDNIFNASMMEERDSFSELRESKKSEFKLRLTFFS